MNHFEHDYANEIAGRSDYDHDPYDDGLGCARGILWGVGLIAAVVIAAAVARAFGWL